MVIILPYFVGIVESADPSLLTVIIRVYDFVFPSNSCQTAKRSPKIFPSTISKVSEILR